MIASSIDENSTIADTFARAVDRYANRPFLAVPPRAERDYYPAGYEITYGEAAREIAALAARYRDAGFGLGHRVALLLENRPEHFLHKIALNSLGVSAVPVNPDYRPAEIAYLVGHCKADGAVVLTSRADQFAQGVAESSRAVSTVMFEDFASGAPKPQRRAESGMITGQTEGGILYTSGTTGRPKGCILSQSYEIGMGAWLALRGGLATPIEGEDRLYTTLPVYHVTSVYTFFRILTSGGCQVQSDRFSPTRWWREVVDSRATVIQYLGVLTSLLAEQPVVPEERQHRVRYAAGASVEPQLHAKLEKRWGFPLIEQWGMTEICRCLGTYHEPRKVGTRACGRPVPELEVRVVDENDNDVPRGMPGELVVRHSAETPRKKFFSGYLDDDAATEDAWRGGWFHTGDVVTQDDDDGMLHFVERRKNIIRRSGENIAAAEVEAVLRKHPGVRRVAVMAVQDELREEEVLACIVLDKGTPSRETAQELFDFCFRQLTYFKAPGWIYFADELPMTGTLKVQKHQIFPADSDPRSLDGMFDMRALKKR